MPKPFLLILSILCVEICLAQSINLEESLSGSDLLNARNGSVALGDIDNDGDPDLVVLGQESTGGLGPLKTTLYENDGNGNFTEIEGTSFMGVQFGHSEFADVDNDGDLDLMYTGSNFSSDFFANLYLNDGNGNFSLDSTTPFQESSEGEFTFEDIDNDGDLDLISTGYKFIVSTSSSIEGFVSLYTNDGTGAFTEVAGTPFKKMEGGALAFIDVENDGDRDVIITGTNSSGFVEINLYHNDGMGNFSLAANTSIEGVRIGDIAVADSDNDGDQDLHICGQTQGGFNTSNIYLNDGTGIFTLLSGTSFPTTSVGTSDFVDFDDDGDVDLLVTGSVVSAEFTSNIYENQGSNNFVLVDSLVDVYFSSTAIADIDGDNDLDAIISGISNENNAYVPRVYFNETITTSIGTIKAEEHFLIFPNPTNGVFQINNGTSSIFTIKVFNSLGQLIYVNNKMEDNSEVKLNQPNGIYLIAIESNNVITTKKLVLKK